MNKYSVEFISLIINSINIITTLFLALSTFRIAKELRDIQIFSNIECYLTRDPENDKIVLVLQNFGPLVIRNITISNNWRSLFCNKYKILNKSCLIESGFISINFTSSYKTIEMYITNKYKNIAFGDKLYLPLDITFFIASSKKRKSVNI